MTETVKLTRPIIGIENRTGQEVFDIMCDRFRTLEPSLHKGEAVAWQWRSRIKGGAWDAWENGRFGQEIPPFMEIEERQVTSPQPVTPSPKEVVE